MRERERERDWPARGEKNCFNLFKIYYCSQLERGGEREREREREMRERRERG